LGSADHVAPGVLMAAEDKHMREEFEDWCRQQGLYAFSDDPPADLLAHPILNKHQRSWLDDFCTRWGL